jgi:NitT/TauT family transport system permease protein
VKLPRRFQPAILPAAILVAWQLAATTRLLDPLFFPPPTTLVASAAGMLRSGDLGQHVRATLSRAASGFLFGLLTGVLCGMAMGVSRTVRRSLEPIVSALYSLPKLTLLPMLMLLVGVGESARLLVIALTVFILIAIHTLDGVRSVSGHYVEMATNCGASSWLVFRRIYLPGSAPQIFTGIRLAAGRSVVVTVSVEMVSARNGLGSLIWDSWQTFATERLYIAVIAAAVIGATVHQSLRFLEKRLVPWRN